MGCESEAEAEAWVLAGAGTVTEPEVENEGPGAEAETGLAGDLARPDRMRFLGEGGPTVRPERRVDLQWILMRSKNKSRSIGTHPDFLSSTSS